MNDNTVYILTKKGNSIIDNRFNTMDEWLLNMSDDQLFSYNEVCEKNSNDRTEEEKYSICSHALVLYCRELDIEEISINNELISRISGIFCVNVIIESLRRKGFVKVNGPLLLYKECAVEPTKDGLEFIKNEKDKK